VQSSPGLMASRLMRICGRSPVHVGLFDQCQRIDAIEYERKVKGCLG